MRERAMKEGRAPGYDGTWRDRGPKDWPKDGLYAVRLKAPREGETVVEDRVQGRVTWQNKDLDDMVLLRSDGTPTYMLAVVVDDHDMGITHIIRGDDHLTNAARQTQIYQCDGMGCAVLLAYSADPRAGRREALQAAWRAWASRLIVRWGICPQPCAITLRGSAGRMAMTRFFRPSRPSNGSISTPSGALRRASTSPSSKI